MLCFGLGWISTSNEILDWNRTNCRLPALDPAKSRAQAAPHPLSCRSRKAYKTLELFGRRPSNRISVVIRAPGSRATHASFQENLFPPLKALWEKPWRHKRVNPSNGFVLFHLWFECNANCGGSIDRHSGGLRAHWRNIRCIAIALPGQTPCTVHSERTESDWPRDSLGISLSAGSE